MTREPGRPPSWQVELSRDAAHEVRGAPPVLRRRLTGLLDQLAHRGLPANSRPLGNTTHSIRIGDVEAVVTVDRETRRILVARLTTTNRPVTHDALRAAHVPLVLSSPLARAIKLVGADVRTALR